MKTEKRIEKIFEAVENLTKLFGEKIIVADIATDHGYLAEKISSLDYVDRVIATDISSKSLDKVIKLKQNKKLDKIEPILGDGLNPIDYADIAVIAGIGGVEITKILAQNSSSKYKFKCRYFVLQPSQNDVWLRNWLYNKKIKIIDDFIIQDGKQFYPVICIDFVRKQYHLKNAKNLYLGCKKHINNQDFVNFLLYWQNTLKFLDNLQMSRIKKDKDLILKYKLKKVIASLLKRC